MNTAAARGDVVRPFLLASFVLGVFASVTLAHADSSDFARDVQTAMNAPGHAKSAFDHEYTSAWDAFGTSAVIPGDAPASEISGAVLSDVTADANRQIGYARAEARYLEAIHSTPEAAQAAEESDGTDLLPQDAIDPFPSADANPDVDYSSADDLQSLNADMQNGTPADTGNPDVSAGSSDTEDISDALAPSAGDWASDDITVFEAIVDTPSAGDVSDSSPSDVSTVPGDATTDTTNPSTPADASAPASDQPALDATQ